MNPPAPAASPASIQSTVLLLSLATFLSGMSLRLCDGLLPRLSSDFGISAGVAGRVVITYSVAYSLMQLVTGPLGDRLGKARMICIALAGCAILSAAAGLSPDFDTLMAARLGWGMAAAGVVPLALAWVGDAVPYEERQPTLARLLTGTLSGMVAGQLAGGLFGDSVWGWRGAFLSIGLGFGLIVVLVASRLRGIAVAPAAAISLGATVRQSRDVLTAPWSLRVLGAAFTEGVLLLGPLAFLPAYLHQRFGLSLSMASGLLALYAVGGLVYALLARRIVRALGERGMVSTGGWLMGAGYLAWWASPVVWTAAPVALIVGFGTYLLHNTLQTHATQMAPAARGTSVSLFAFSLFFGQAVGVSLAGLAFDYVGSGPLLLVPAVTLPLLGLAFARALRRRQPA